MDEFSFLETTAEISIAFAGFVSIFLVLARRDGSFSPDYALTIRSILMSSIICLGASAAPLILASLGSSGPALWRSASVGVLAAFLGLTFYMSVNRRKLPSEQRGTAFARVGWSLATLAILVLAANTLGRPIAPNPGLYLLSLWLVLGIASTNFLDLVFRGVLGGAKA